MKIKFYVTVNGERFCSKGGGNHVAGGGITVEISCAQVAGGVVYSPTVTNQSGNLATIDEWGAEFAGFNNRNADWNLFYDKGSCGWCGVKKLSYLKADERMGVIKEQAAGVRHVEQSELYHHSDMATVLWDNANKQGTLIGFTLQREGSNHILVTPGKDGNTVLSAVAAQQLGQQVAANESIKPDSLTVTTGQNPYKLLEYYGELVQAAHGKTFSHIPIVGMMTWYGYHTAVTEEVVRENAAIIAGIFNGYPQPMTPLMLIDHGWEHDACWGDFRVDSRRFPNGLKWLSQEIGKHGIKLGLWHTPFCISWNAPNREELTPLMRRNKDGSLEKSEANVWGHLPGHAFGPNPVWYFNGGLDKVQKRWVQEFKQLKDWGAVYSKIDFFSLAADDSVKISNGDLYKKTWANFRKGAGDMHLAPCSCPTNMQAGYCDSIRIGSDIGIAGGWPGASKQYVYGHSTMGALWYKHRKFWVNDGDSVQVGRGCSLNEARLRLTSVAFTGGHFMLSEDLRHIDETRIAMIRRMLPATPYAAVPINMFEQPFPDQYADIWALTVNGQTSLALFNLLGQERSFTVTPEMFGFAPGQKFTVLEWWGCKWLGTYDSEFTVCVPSEDVFILHAFTQPDAPTVFSTSHHHAGAYILDNIAFDTKTGELSGQLITKPGQNIVLFGLSAGWRLTRQERSHTIINSLGGFQSEVTTTSQRTAFKVSFQRT